MAGEINATRSGAKNANLWSSVVSAMNGLSLVRPSAHTFSAGVVNNVIMWCGSFNRTNFALTTDSRTLAAELNLNQLLFNFKLLV